MIKILLLNRTVQRDVCAILERLTGRSDAAEEGKKRAAAPPRRFAWKVSAPLINVFIVVRVLAISGLPVWKTFLTASGTLLLLLGDEDALPGHGHGNAIKTLSP